MEIKKSPKANLENKKLLFKEIGLVIALGLTLLAFNWSTSEKAVSTLEADQQVEVEEEIVPITNDTPPPPPETSVAEPVMSDIIDIVDDDIKVDTKIIINEDDKNQGVEIKEYVQAAEIAEEVVEDDVIPFAIVEDKPMFQGKDANEFTKWVYNNIVYPEIAKENGVQGRVTLQFEIGKDGTVTNVKVLRGVDSSLDKEAVRVVSNSPKWTPGKQRGKAVKVKYNFPVTFQLK
ncbi:MAG: energy transducer TonB [Bacteroidales bacterium]|nr:energy transducer TonB [Bacteroidales bacterium]